MKKHARNPLPQGPEDNVTKEEIKRALNEFLEKITGNDCRFWLHLHHKLWRLSPNIILGHQVVKQDTLGRESAFSHDRDIPPWCLQTLEEFEQKNGIMECENAWNRIPPELIIEWEKYRDLIRSWHDRQNWRYDTVITTPSDLWDEEDLQRLIKKLQEGIYDDTFCRIRDNRFWATTPTAVIQCLPDLYTRGISQPYGRLTSYIFMFPSSILCGTITGALVLNVWGCDSKAPGMGQSVSFEQGQHHWATVGGEFLSHYLIGHVPSHQQVFLVAGKTTTKFT